MKAKINRQVLHGAAAKASKIVNKSIVDVMNCLLIEVEGDQIAISANSMELAIKTKVSGATSDENFTCLVEADLLLSVISKMKSNDIVLEKTLVRKEEYLLLKGGAVKMKIRCLNADKWSHGKKIEEPDFSVETDFLLPAIAQCKHSLADKSDTPIKCSFCVQYNKNDWMITALDGYRISSRGTKNWETKPEHEILLPGHSMILLQSILEEQVKLEVEDEIIRISDSCTEVYLRSVAGTYFNLTSMLNHDLNHYVKFEKAELLELLELACVLCPTSDKRPIKLVIEDNLMSVIAQDKTENDMNGSIPVESNFRNRFTMGMNPKYLLDALRSIPDENIEFRITNNVMPVVISGENYKEVVLPVRIVH